MRKSDHFARVLRKPCISTSIEYDRQAYTSLRRYIDATRIPPTWRRLLLQTE